MIPIRFGVIGAGHTGVGTARGDSFIRLLSTMSDAVVTAVCDIDCDNAVRAAKLADATPYTELDTFLSSGLDAVIICTPIRFHVEQAIASLQHDIHVLSEVPAAHSLPAAAELADAVAASSAHYMLAENYRYLDEIELVKRLILDNRFGYLYFAEGEYIHDCKDLWYNQHGIPTWRGASGKTPGYGVYCTHSLGPLLYLLDDRPITVSAAANETSKVIPDREGFFNFIMLIKTAKGATLRLRIDTVSPRPHAAAYYSLQGNRGCYESYRGLGDKPKIWLVDEHEPSQCFQSPPWQILWDYAERYISDRLNIGESARTGGHGTTEYWMLRDFITSIQRDVSPPIDVYHALDYTVPGFCALASVEQGGAPIPIPDFRPSAL